MPQLTSIARPYAKAIYELALQKNSLRDWSFELNWLAAIANDKSMRAEMSNPVVPWQELAEMFIDIANSLIEYASNLEVHPLPRSQGGGGVISREVVHLVKMLAQKKRLNLLPDIAKLYEKLVSQREKTIEVKVVSAYPIDQARLQRLTHALQNNLKRRVTLKCFVDNTLLGGVIIYADDRVIDGSLRNKLERLSERLCS